MTTQAQYDQQMIDICDFMESKRRRLANGGICGSRKTTTTIRAIAKDIELHPEHKWIIAVPLHKIVDGPDNILDWCNRYGLDAEHIWGKQSKVDKELVYDNFEEEKCYDKGCGVCKEKDTCGFFNQGWEAQVLVCSHEFLSRIERFIGDWDNIRKKYMVSPIDQWYGLVVEEEPTSAWMKEIPISKQMEKYIELGTTHIIKDYWSKGTVYTFTDVTIKPIKKVKGIKLTMNERRLQNISIYGEDFKVHKHGKDLNMLFYHQKYLTPFYVKKIIFNCATTPAVHRDMIFKQENWKEIGIKEPITNPIISVGYHWGKTNTGNRIKYLRKFLHFLEASGKKVLLITKDFVQKDIGVNTDIVHYNSGRGFNNFNKPYDIIVVYGNYKLQPGPRLRRVQMGIQENTIDKLENAEVLQSINRFRPYSHKDTPVIMMTQHIEDYHSESWITVPDKILEVYSEYPYIHESNVDTKEIVEKYGRHSNTGLKEFVSFMRHHVFNLLSRDKQIVQSKIEGKNIDKIMKRFDISRGTVSKVFKNFLKENKISKYKKRIFELK